MASKAARRWELEETVPCRVTMPSFTWMRMGNWWRAGVFSMAVLIAVSDMVEF